MVHSLIIASNFIFTGYDVVLAGCLSPGKVCRGYYLRTILLKLADDVNIMDDVVADNPMCSSLLSTVFNLRRNPKFSLLSFVLTTMEDALLKRMISGINSRCSSREICLLCDGYVASPSEEGDIAFDRDVRITADFLGVTIPRRRWVDNLGNITCFAQRLIIAGYGTIMEGSDNQIKRRPGPDLCLVHSIMNIRPECDVINSMRSGPYSAHQFNEMAAASNHNGGALWQMVHTAETSFRPGSYLCLRDTGWEMHFFGFVLSDAGCVIISDDALPLSVSVASSDFETALPGLRSLSVFSLAFGNISVPEHGSPYLVGAGSGPTRYCTFETHLQRCNQCGCAICPFRTNIAEVLYPTGARQVLHRTFRCVGKRRRAYFGANFSQSKNGAPRNTARSLGDVGPVLMISKRSGFSKTYMSGFSQCINTSPQFRQLSSQGVC